AAEQDGVPAELAVALVELVSAVHERGWVLRDLSSNNVMITPERTCVLIDPEFAARTGDLVARIYTPGFAAPETLDGAPFGPAPDPAADRFALGAMLIHLVLGQAPFFLTEYGAGHTLAGRIRQLLALAEPQRPLIRQWWPLLTGLCETDPADRWTLEQAAGFLRAGQRRSRVELPTRSTDDERNRVLADGLDHLLATVQPNAEWLWKQEAFGATTDPLNVQYGAAGVLAVLARAAEHGHPVTTGTLSMVAGWMRDRIDRTPRVLPGLYFGRAGTAWALRETAALLDDAELAVRAEQFALRLPLRWPNPDVCHGAAGAGLSQLRFWQLSGRDEFLDRARDCADGLLAAAHHTDDGVFWPVPADFDSSLAGVSHFGFAHGVAGVGAFLLAAGQACADTRYLQMADAAGQTLAAAAEIGESGSATWRTDRGSQAGSKDMRYHWCSGASGIGSFLLRLATAQPNLAMAGCYRDLAHAAAQAVHEARWFSGTASCHGLAGNGQFLLDILAVAEQAGSPDAARYRRWAEDIVDVLLTRHAVQQGRMLIPDESATRITAGYGTGLAGVLDFLLRLRHGGPRSWMIEPS
ncbi:MAG TPA: lanthionine synthetase LanC family protein, partial [Jatrophihabitans sp.]|nr:lanthionine synthetase LanC family protein [Jatrophihabitans sp.]